MPASATKHAPAKAPSARDEGLFSSPQKRSVVLCLALAVVTLLLYNPVAGHDFVNFDDDHYIYENAHVRAGLGWKAVTWALGSMQEANWHPVTWISHALDVSLFGMNPAGHHYTNLLLHTINVLLLFLLLNRATGFRARSLLVAALFAVHPINVESVAWVSERKNLLCTLFFLLAAGAYGWYAQKPGVKRYGVVTGMFALGLMSKPMVITFPFVLLLLDFWPLGRVGHLSMEGTLAGIKPGLRLEVAKRSFAQLFLEKVPFVLMSAVSAIITLSAQKAGGAVRSAIEYSWSSRVANAFVSYAAYIGKGIWPTHLSAMYPLRHTVPSWEVAGAAVLLVGITATVLVFKRFPYLAVGWLWFLGIMVPVIGLVQVGVQAMADRYAYIPYLGLFTMALWGIAQLARQRPALSRILTTAAVVIVAAFAGMTRIQEGYWRNSISLWSHALAVTSENYVAEDNLGQALISEGRFDEAIGHFRYAAQINASDPISQLNIGFYENMHGRPEQAIQHYESALRLTSDRQLRSHALVNLGSAHRALGDQVQARRNYEAALQLAPDSSLALMGMGLVSQRTGDLNQAINYYSRAAAEQSTDVGYLLLAQALAQAGHIREAELASQEARRLSRDWSQTQKSVNHLLAE